jgi:hypothetical protein
VTAVLTGLIASCSSAPSPEPVPTPQAGITRTVAGAQDSVEAIPGAPDAAYYYRFRQIDPASDRFQFQDRDLSFYFKPTPEALRFQVENRQNHLVWIVWDKSSFLDPTGRSGQIAHSTTRWVDRFKNEPDTQIPGLTTYADYVIPLDWLYDPAGSTEQLHRPLFPEDQRAPQYTDRLFGVDLSFLVDQRPVTYSFRFKVVSVIAR